MDFSDLFHAYEVATKPTAPHKIIFSGAAGYDVYNITAPFTDRGRTYIAGRVELRTSEDAEVRFFERVDATHYRASTLPTLHLQDPFVTRIGSQLVVGGVHVTPQADGTMRWRTDFYVGQHLDSLEFLVAGPDQMKDIRLAETPDHQILVLTRPQGGVAGAGKIGMCLIDRLAQLTAERIATAPLLADNIPDGNWGGPNQVLAIDRSTAVVLGHLARRKADQTLQYTSVIFEVDYRQQRIARTTMIATREDFEDGPAKRPDLTDVIFSGGYADGKLYVGTGDAEAQFAAVELKGYQVNAH
ncbi:DUF1861 family protein [Lacticaseibacillus absianus]|uniref:DUF1861 family protein n=1 Tax=Lacticaseibacillus absianus TaxID=2729623 RepID=UPI0015CCFC95|nr:DUF1861 family protein [Lacticaseibacillus absianus]